MNKILEHFVSILNQDNKIETYNSIAFHEQFRSVITPSYDMIWIQYKEVMDLLIDDVQLKIRYMSISDCQTIFLFACIQF